MTVYDISRDLLTAPVYPGDITPTAVSTSSTARGDNHNKSHLELTSHSGTHMDAPSHFIHGGRTIDQMEPERFTGSCTVWETSGRITREALAPVLNSCEKRLLIKGDIILGDDIAPLIAEAGLYLLGVEGLTIGEPGKPMRAHITLLSKEVLILESLDLSNIAPGKYLLCAAPVKIGGCDGAPCRAVLMAE